MSGPSHHAGWLPAGPQPFVFRALWLFLMIAVLLRLTINNVSPALPLIQVELGMGPALAGLTSTLPLLCFSVFALAAAPMLRRWDVEPTIAVLLALLVAGALIRLIPTTAGLLGGTAVIGIGAALGNAVVPVAIREFYPVQAGRYMGFYAAGLSIGAAAGAATTMPLISAGWHWTVAINFWVVVNLMVLAWWLAGWRIAHQLHRTSSQRRNPKAEAHRTIKQIIGSRGVWLVCAHMGFQVSIFFAVMTWAPTWLQVRGVDAEASGLVVGAFSLAGIVGAVIGPRLQASRHWWTRPLYTAIFVLTLLTLGFNGLPGAGWLVWVGAIVAGACSGAMLSMSLVMITGYRDVSAVPALSALANAVGFALAAALPVGLGAWAEWASTWTPAIWAVALLPVVVLVLNFSVQRAMVTAGARTDGSRIPA